MKEWFENNFDIETVLIPQENGGYKVIIIFKRAWEFKLFL